MGHLSILVGAALARTAVALVSKDNVGRLPAMGWNSWNEYGCNISESVFLTAAQELVSTGLKDAGYIYVNIDDCWGEKNNGRQNGKLIANKSKFPNGISGLATKIHGMGLKLGIYSDAGSATCEGYPASLGNEAADAATFAEWGVDYLKYDNCNVPSNWNDQYSWTPEGMTTNAPRGYDWGTSKSAQRYATMRDALQKQNRTILFSMCNWGQARIDTWGNKTGHSWRMAGDILPEWSGKYTWHQSWGITNIVNNGAFFWNGTNFWGHGDWDMLEVGNGNLTTEENRSHFVMWAALKSPLIIGAKLHTMSKTVLDILSNKEIIAFNQDPVYGASAMPYKWGYNKDFTYDTVHPAEYWVGNSIAGVHVFMFNTRDNSYKMSAKFSEIPPLKNLPASTQFIVHNMWTGKDIGVFSGEYAVDVAKHDTAALRITLQNGNHPNPTWTSI